ncbi:MAG: AAA family ATPase [Bacteroidaceae bacterium]|nr:AAA family ATPase [Bacteroidaceae bacterium]
MNTNHLICQSNESIEKTIAMLPSLEGKGVESIIIDTLRPEEYNAGSYRKLLNEAHSLNIRVIQKVTIETRSMINTFCMALVRFFTLIVTQGVDAVLFDHIETLPLRNLRRVVGSLDRLNPSVQFYGSINVDADGKPVLPVRLTLWERLYYLFKGVSIRSVSNRYSRLLDGMIDGETLSLQEFAKPSSDDNEVSTARRHVSVTDMVLDEEEKRTADEILSILRNVPEIVSKYSTSTSLLKELDGSFLFVLAGPPGSGKTLFAQMLADEMGREYVEVSLADILGRLVGDSERQLSELFATAQKEHQILIFNEGDALFCARSNADSAAADNKLVSHALTLLENSRVDCFITTNRAGAIDFAVKSRTLRTININAPSAECLGRLYEKNLREFPFLDKNVDYVKLGEASVDFSYRDVNKTILIALGKMAARSNYVLTQSILEEAISERVNNPQTGKVSEESLARFVKQNSK